ncbi:MAG TPA: hypothetical protein VIU86_20080 [Gaiellaceae bacterium]
MSTSAIPKEWATNPTFVGGDHAGEPTKVDPGSAIVANGFYPDIGFAAEHVNNEWSALSKAARRAALLGALRLRKVQQEGQALDASFDSMGAVTLGPGTNLVVGIVNSTGIPTVSDWDRFTLQGPIASITSLVTDGATNGDVMVLIGTGGNKASYSLDGGATWNASSNDMGVAGGGTRIVWANAQACFFAGGPSAASLKVSTNGGSGGGGNWTSRSVSTMTGVQGLAVSGSNLFLLDTLIVPAFFVLAGTASVAATGGTVANAGSADESGTIAGNNGSVIYHCMRYGSGAHMQVSSSSDGATWNTLKTFIPGPLSDFSAGPRIMMCQSTGLLVIAVPVAGSTQIALYASLDGADWVGPALIEPAPDLNAFAVAGGRLLAYVTQELYKSDGIGQL